MTSRAIDVVEELLGKLQKLMPDQQQQVLAFVEFLLWQRVQSIQQPMGVDVVPLTSKPRVFGQYQGQIWMSDDFNDPLPDEFWLAYNSSAILRTS